MKSKIFSSEYVKISSKGQIWIPILLGLGFLLAFPMAGLLQLGNWSALEYTQEQMGCLYENLWRDGYLTTGYIVICIAAVINGINGFWYLYSSRKTDFYHSLPINRRNMFCHKIYTGVLYYLIPYLIMEFLAVCIGAMRGFFSLHLMGVALSMLVFHLILYFLMYFSTVLVVCVTGNILMGGLCLFGFFFYNVFLRWLLESYREIFYITNYPHKDYGLLRFIRKYASAPMLGKSFIESRAEGDYLWFLTALVIVTAVLGLLSYTAYVKRPSERSGRPMIYRWVAVLVKFLVVVPCGMGVGLIFFLLPTNSSRNLWGIFGLVLGTVLSHGMMEVLYNVDFRKFFSSKLQFAAAALLVILCTSCYSGDFLGYDSYLPSQEKIAGLYVDMYMDGYGYSYVIPQEDGTYVTGVSWDEEGISFSGVNGIGNTLYGALRSIVESQAEYRRTEGLFMLRKLFSGYGGTVDAEYTVPVKFVSTSGREVYRNYSMTSKQVRELQIALYEEEGYRDMIYSALKIKPEYLTGVRGGFSDGSVYALFQGEDSKLRELLAAYREDVNEAAAGELVEQPCASLEFAYKLPVKQDVSRMIPGENSVSFHSGFLYVCPSFERTIAILEKTGYPLSMEEVPLTSVRMCYYDLEVSMYDPEEILYEEPRQLEELKKSMVAGILKSSAVNYRAGVDITYTLEGETGEVYGYLREENLPDFVKEQVE